MNRPAVAVVIAMCVPRFTLVSWLATVYIPCVHILVGALIWGFLIIIIV